MCALHVRTTRSTRLRALMASWLVTIACGGKPIARHGPLQQQVVSRTFGEPPSRIRGDILAAFGEDRSALPSPFQQMIVSELKPPRFSSDWLTTFVDPGDFLKAYKALDPSIRSNDLSLEEPTGDKYWRSEYTTANGPVQFRCGFILHFVDASDGTTVEVFESIPTVWAGEHWAWAIHGIGFGRFHDIRFVEPTVTDRVRVLDLVEQVVRNRG